MIRKANMSDVNRICELFKLSRARMAEQGNPTQWSGAYPAQEDAKQDIERGDCYVLEDEGGIYAVFSLIFGKEPTYDRIYDGKWLSDEPYATIHRVASDGAHHGVFKGAVEYSKALYPNLRTDTHRNNAAMRAAIHKAGFKYCGVIYVDHPSDNERLAYQYAENEG